MSYIKPYPSPCDTCTLERCLEKKCVPWKIRYLYRQKQINAYAEKQGLVIGKGRMNDNA